MLTIVLRALTHRSTGRIADSADKLLALGESQRDAGRSTCASWPPRPCIASVILNLDETMTKE